MNSPYSNQPDQAFAAAQLALGLVTTGVFLARPLRPRMAQWGLLVAQWLAVEAMDVAGFFRAMTHGSHQMATFDVLAVSRVLVVISAALMGRLRLLPWVALAFGFLTWTTRSITDSEWELTALHAMFAPCTYALFATHQWRSDVRSLAAPSPGRSPFRVDDAALAILAIVVGTLVAAFVLDGTVDSSDEWGYTYQAAVFAKGRVYGKVPPCLDAFRNFWIFWKDDRMFAQYQPGWPLFMAPFFWVRAEVLAGPVSFGLLAVAVARLGRRAAAAVSGSSVRAQRIGGLVAALSVIFANTMMINAGSRFPHVFVCALWAWAMEGACSAQDASSVGDPKRVRHAALVAGLALGFLGLTRGVELATLGLPIGLFSLQAVLRKKLRPMALVWAALPVALCLALLLVLSRLQVGRWFVLPYQLTEEFHAWAKMKTSAPPLNMVKWHVPMATGAYCWWPLAPSLGLAGLLPLLRSPERRLPFMLVLGSLLLLVYYASIEFGRGWDFGFGPRYQMPVIVPMAVGASALLTPIFLRAQRVGVGLVLAGMAYGVLRILPVTFPHNHDLLLRNDAPVRAARAAGLHHVIVKVTAGTWVYGPMDATRNLPIELYDNDVLLVGDSGPQSLQCVRSQFPDRPIYKTAPGPGTDLTLTPE